MGLGCLQIGGTPQLADPRLDASIVDELPREQDHSTKFKLIESRIRPGAETEAPAP